MKRTCFAAALLSLLLLPGTPVTARHAPQDLPGAPDDQGQEVGESPERYAQVKAVEGVVTVRKGETDETLTRGVPVAEGDVVESNGRGILQLGDGSALAFGNGTRFKVASLFSDQDQVRRVLVILEKGELRVRKGTFSDALIRVDTPAGSGTLGNRGNAATRPDATFQVTPGPKGAQVVFLVHASQATFANDRSQTQVFAGQRLTVYGLGDNLDRLGDFNAYSLDEFDLWAEDLVKPRPSESASRVPPEIRYFADDLDANGKWVYVDDCSAWCWSPTTVADDWRPYCDGYWGAYDGGMTWISLEPWGYLTHHHGRWGWGAGLGWYWIPGIYYSPAWVAWNCSGGYFGWAPLGYWNRPCRWGYGVWNGGYAWNVVNLDYVHVHNLRHRLYNDPGVLHAFNASGAGPRPWTQGRLMVSAAEFRDPARFQQVATQPALSRSRLEVYARTAQAATGRTLLRPEPGLQGRGAVAFNRVEQPETAVARPLLRTTSPFQVQAPFQSPSQPATSGSAQRPFTEGQARGTRVTTKPSPNGLASVQANVPSNGPTGATASGGASSEPQQAAREERRRQDTQTRPQDTPATQAHQRTSNDERPREEHHQPAAHAEPAPSPRPEAHAAPRTETRPAPAPTKDHK